MSRHLFPVLLILAVSATLGIAIVDTDSDGMSDVWEQNHGFSTADDGALFPNQAPSADPDRDGPRTSHSQWPSFRQSDQPRSTGKSRWLM